MSVRTIDLTGMRFGRLVVTAKAPLLSAKNTRWECRCDCGNTTIAQSGALRGGRNNSCGCLQRDTATKHGQEGSLTYTVWAQMKARCLNQKHKSYKDYGARGITVCERWMLFENFFDDMGEKPDGLSLDRKDNSLGYYKDNCRWADDMEQNNNRRSSRILEHEGQKKSVAEWARIYGISPISIRSRLKLNWDVHKALTTPIDKRKASKQPKS